MSITFLIVLLFIGLLLITAEIFFPGFGIIGMSGVAIVIIAAALTILFVPFGLIIVLSVLIFSGVCIFFLIKWAKSKQLYGSLVLKEVLSMEKKEVDNFDKLIGKEGVTEVPLKPFGSASFNGVKFDVCSDGAYVPKGRAVKVINVHGDKIIVKEMN